METRKLQVEIHPKRAYVNNNSYFSKDYNFFKSTCFYCNRKCHTLNVCHIRNFDVPNGEYVWEEKKLNQKDPKNIWYLESIIDCFL